MNESAITAQIMRWLKAQPDVFAWKTIGSVFTQRGIPDICGSVSTVALYLEVKTDKGRVSRSQQVIHNRIAASGSLVFVVRSLDAAKQAIERLRDIAATATR